MKLLITGGAGFIGSAVVRLAVARGHEVVNLDALTYAACLDNVASAGYCFQVDLAWRALKSGFRVVEVPITFIEREYGTSKMSKRIVIEALVLTTVWGVGHRTKQLRALVTKRKVLTS